MTRDEERSIFRFQLMESLILESDYGDYMRQAEYHLLNLKEDMSRLPYYDVQIKIQEMEGYLQFHSNWSIDLTRKKIVKDTLIIQMILDGHQQDWQSA